jgi:hypothetical protein
MIYTLIPNKYTNNIDAVLLFSIVAGKIFVLI